MLVLKGKGRGQRIDVLTFSPAGDVLLAAGNGSWLDVWRFDGSPPARFFEAADYTTRVFDVRFLGDTTVVASCGSAGLRVLSLASGVVVEEGSHPCRGHVSTLAVGPDGRVIGVTQSAAGSGYECWVTADGGLRPAWFRATPGLWPGGLAFMPRGRHFVSTERTAAPVGERVTALVVRSCDTGEPYEEYDCPYAFVEQLAFCPGGGHLLARAGMALAIWPDGEPSRTPRKVQNDNRQHFTGIAFHPSGQYLAATSNDTTVKLYDTATWRLARTFTWQVGRLRSVAFSPDGTRAAVGSDTGKIVIWDVDL